MATGTRTPHTAAPGIPAPHIPTPRTLSLTPEESAALLRTHYDLDPVRLTPLNSELSTVLRVDLADGTSRLFRASCSSPSEDTAALWRIEAADHLAARGVPTARTIPTNEGAALVAVETSGGPAIVQLSTWLTGSMLSDVAAGPALLREVGRTAAEVAGGLAQWPTPPVDVGHSWELTRALDTIANTIGAVTDPEARTLLDEVVARFHTIVAPQLGSFPHQVVHHDLHDSNLLVDPATDTVTGVIDFGDMVWGPRIADLAIPATHAARSAADPAAAFLQVAEGWGHLTPLTAAEIDLVFTAGLGRLGVNLSVWTSRITSDRAEYARARSVLTKQTLTRLLAADEPALRAQLHRILG